MNTKRQYKFASMTHAYQAFDSVVKENSDLLAMLERVTDDLQNSYNACAQVSPNIVPKANAARLADARALIAKVKGE